MVNRGNYANHTKIYGKFMKNYEKRGVLTHYES